MTDGLWRRKRALQPVHHYTLLDGEMVVDTDARTGAQRRRYLAYDCLALNGESVVHRSFAVRRRCMGWGGLEFRGSWGGVGLTAPSLHPTAAGQSFAPGLSDDCLVSHICVGGAAIRSGCCSLNVYSHGSFLHDAHGQTVTSGTLRMHCFPCMRGKSQAVRCGAAVRYMQQAPLGPVCLFFYIRFCKNVITCFHSSLFSMIISHCFDIRSLCI